MDENFNDLVMACTNCHLEFYASELRADVQTNLLMCVNCLSSPGSKVTILKDRPLKKKQSEENAFQRMVVPPKKEQIKPAMAKVETQGAAESQYRCTSCRYEFRRKAGFSGNCPYCAKKTVATMRAH